MTFGSFANLKRFPRFCRKCPETAQARSKIAKKSNSSRKIRHAVYEPYLDDLKSGKITFLEIAHSLGKDDSTVCKWYHSNFGIKSKHGNKSLQEDAVYGHLMEIFGTCARSIRYSNETRHIADYQIPGVGYLEYDGSGFYHQVKNDDGVINEKYSPIRLNAQAYFGGADYLRAALLGKKTGYCAASSPKEYSVRQMDKISQANEMLENCHILKSSAGRIVFGLYHNDHLIGVAKFGNPTSPADKSMLELRRFFVLDGTPRNAESWFLDKCLKLLPKSKNLVTFIHHNEKGSYLKALGWNKQPQSHIDYDSYLINGRLISKRTLWGWAKKIGLVDKFGTTDAKEILAAALGGIKIIEPAKIKFIYTWGDK
jgi:hypothetical protein